MPESSTLSVNRRPKRSPTATVPPRTAWLWWIVAIASVLMAAYALSYFVLGERLYPEQLADSFRSRPWGIYTHAAFGALGLGLGPFQFRRTLRERAPEWHRLLGKVYLASALMVGLSGVYMALHSFGGAATHLGFGFMGAALLVTTGVAFARIRAGKVAAHREWMIRSFSVMFAAVTFRFWLPVLALVFDVALAPAYQWASWLAWAVNLLAAEWYIRWSRATRSLPARRERMRTETAPKVAEVSFVGAAERRGR